MIRLARFTMFVTGDCTLNCPYCSQARLRRRLAGYQMSLAEVRHFIHRCRQLGVRYKRLQPSGGEPTLWKHLEPALKLLEASGIAERLYMVTNGTRPKEIHDTIKYFHQVRVSLYPHNVEQAADLARRYPDKIEVWDDAHRRVPSKPLVGVLPSDCGCDWHSLAAGRVYSCPQALDLALRLGLDPDGEDLSCSVDDDFPRHFQRRQPSRYVQPICAMCLANRNVWDRQAGSRTPAAGAELSESIPRRKRITWAVGLTTAPRSRPTLHRTLASLRQAGWREVEIFDDRLKTGAWANWIAGLGRLIQDSPAADYYLMCQDDVVFCRGLRRHLEATLPKLPRPEKAALYSPYCIRRFKGKRWHVVRAEAGRRPGLVHPGGSLTGALCYALPGRAAKALIADRSGLKTEKNVDAHIGIWAHKTGRDVWYHSPSLAQHIGCGISTLGHREDPDKANRRADDFIGEDRQP